jgi:Ribbon-helix-helix protein, copG family
MYTFTMKRLQIYIDEDLDAALAVESRRAGTSKAALIRECVARQYRDRLASDPLEAAVGFIEGSPGDSRAVDDVVYGPWRLRRHVVLGRAGGTRRPAP